MMGCNRQAMSRLIIMHWWGPHVRVAILSLGSLTDLLKVRGTKICARSTHIAHTTVSRAWAGDHGCLWSVLSWRILDTIRDRWRRGSHVSGCIL